MINLRKLISVLFQGRPPLERVEGALAAEFQAAQKRLHDAQSDFARVVREVLDENERLRQRHAAKATRSNPRP